MGPEVIAMCSAPRRPAVFGPFDGDFDPFEDDDDCCMLVEFERVAARGMLPRPTGRRGTMSCQKNARPRRSRPSLRA